MKKLKKEHIILIAVIAVVVALVFCRNMFEKPVSFDNTGTTCGNIVMGSGKFASENGFVYFATADQIIEYDLESGKSVFLNLKNAGPQSLTITYRDIYYTAQGSIFSIRKDGKRTETIFESDIYGIKNFYVDEHGAYFMNAIEGSVFQLDMETMQVTELISGINSFFVDKESLYVVARDEEKQWQLYYRGLDEAEFKTLELSFHPIAVYANEQGLYLAQKGSYQITHVVNGVETELPCQSILYQILDNQLIYLDKNTYENSCFILKSYDLITGVETVLAEKVYDFGIVEERYIACQLINPVGGQYILIDTQTGETIPVLVEEEE